MSTTTNGRRAYTSELRALQAEQTRARIVDAAVARFGEAGYEKTTLTDIAKEAKVSAETVRLHGPKSALMVAAARCLTHDPDDGSLLETEIGAAYLAQPDPESFLDFTIGVSLEINRRTAGVYAAFASAAAGDPELEREWFDLLAARRRELDELVGIWIDRGWARTDLPRDELVASVWVVTMPETYDRLTRYAGYDDDRYLGWLRRSLAEVLLPRG